MTNKEILAEIAEYEELLNDSSVPQDEKEMAREEIADLKSKLKEEKPVEKAPKAEPKQKAEKVEKPKQATEKNEDYNCDDLIKKAKERHAKAKKAAEARANAPKKSDATRDKDKIEKVQETVEKHIEKGKFTRPQLEKLIAETKDLLKLLEKALKDL
jgi:hypothetical protein